MTYTPEYDPRDEDPDPPRKRYRQCADGMCGADDCPNCKPWNFRAGVYVGDIEDEEESET